MPKYLTLGKYSAEGTKGFLKERAAAREAALRKAIESAGGKLETVYWVGTGEYNIIAISEYPDAATGAAITALFECSGAISHIKNIELLTSSELDHALSKSMTYRPPGVFEEHPALF